MTIVPNSSHQFKAIIQITAEDMVWLDKIIRSKFFKLERKFMKRKSTTFIFTTCFSAFSSVVLIFATNPHIKYFFPVGITIYIIICMSFILKNHQVKSIRRRQISRLVADNNREVRQLVGGPFGLKGSSSGQEWSCTWNSLRDVIFDAERTAIFFNDLTAIVIPHRCLSKSDDIDLLRAYTAQIGSAAQTEMPIV